MLMENGSERVETMRLINADALKRIYNGNGAFTEAHFRTAIDEAPTVDAVPVKSIEQLKWERDTAIEQLEEHGIPFCGKADVVAVVRCVDCLFCNVDIHRYCADKERAMNDIRNGLLLGQMGVL